MQLAFIQSKTNYALFLTGHVGDQCSLTESTRDLEKQIVAFLEWFTMAINVLFGFILSNI